MYPYSQQRRTTLHPRFINMKLLHIRDSLLGAHVFTSSPGRPWLDPGPRHWSASTWILAGTWGPRSYYQRYVGYRRGSLPDPGPPFWFNSTLSTFCAPQPATLWRHVDPPGCQRACCSQGQVAQLFQVQVVQVVQVAPVASLAEIGRFAKIRAIGCRRPPATRALDAIGRGPASPYYPWVKGGPD